MTMINTVDLILNKKLIYKHFSNIVDLTIRFEEDYEINECHFIFDIELNTADTEKVLQENSNLIKDQMCFFASDILFMMITSFNLIEDDDE